MINNFFCDQSLYTSMDCCRQMEMECADSALDLANEHAMTLSVEEIMLQRFVCSPAQLAELCVGWLCGEGFIKTEKDVKNLWISENGCTAKAFLEPIQKREAEAFPSFIPLKDDLCKQAANILRNEDSVYSKTRGTHGCVYLSDDGRKIFCEDIGRNNAIDKTIGKALLQGLETERGLLFSSGRITADIVRKVVRAGIPVLASKAAVTSDAIEAANRYRLRLAFFADNKLCVIPTNSSMSI